MHEGTSRTKCEFICGFADHDSLIARDRIDDAEQAE